jgi:hypothetical protein
MGNHQDSSASSRLAEVYSKDPIPRLLQITPNPAITVEPYSFNLRKGYNKTNLGSLRCMM